MAAGNSSRGKRPRRRLNGAPSRATSPTVPAPQTPDLPDANSLKPGFDEILARFSDALCFPETACRALQAGEESAEGASNTPMIRTLEHGLRALQNVYTELDLAIMKLEG